MGGHSHIALSGIKEGINLFRSKRNKEPVLVLHSGAYGEGIGVTYLIFNDRGILQVDEQRPVIETKLISSFKRLMGISDPKKLKTTKNILVE